ncbi:MAG: ABC transporter permease [Cyclobacteriaceae bacterium]
MKPLDHWSVRLLRLFCPPHLLEEIEGDLIQRYEKDVEAVGDGKANWRLAWNTVRYFRPEILLRNRFRSTPYSTAIIGSHMSIAFRNITRHKIYALVNIGGLAIGISVCLLIVKYIQFETSFDSFHQKEEKILRVVSSLYTDGSKDSYTSYDLGPALMNEYPEIEKFARTHGTSSVVKVTSKSGKETRFYEPDILVADSTLLEIFDFEFVHGDKKALYEPNSVVLTESLAQKYFGGIDPTGLSILLLDDWSGPYLYTVAAVIRDLPQNTHFKFEMIIPMHNLLRSEFYYQVNSRWDNFQTYVEVNENVNPDQLNERIEKFITNYRGNDEAINPHAQFEFQPLEDIHYSPDLNRPGSELTKLILLSMVAFAILIIAWINYVNIATARGTERAREVGVKKSLGVLRTQLIFQFILESFTIHLFSVVAAILVVLTLSPIVQSIVGINLSISLTQKELWIIVGALYVAGSFFAGIYPAFVLSSFKTTEVIKGKIITRKSERLHLRSALVVFQFASSLILIIGTVIIYLQLSFMRQQDKKLITDQVLIVRGPMVTKHENLRSRMAALRSELLQYSQIKKTATSYNVPAMEPSIGTGCRKLGSPESANRIGAIYWVDPYFMDLFQIKLVSGRFWDEDHPSDQKKVIINEEAVKAFQLGSQELALDEKLILLGDTLAIIGVVENHHWHSLKQPYTPMIFKIESTSDTNLSVLFSGNPEKVIADINQEFKKTFPDETFDYYFLNDSYDNQYQAEQQFGKLLAMFSYLAILVGCLGLWGLASYTVIHRMKEVSIRKILGASVNSILVLLSGEFLRPILISSMFAFPLIWFATTKWLGQFPYRISLSPEIFLFPLLFLLAIAAITVGAKTFHSANANPIDSLRE